MVGLINRRRAEQRHHDRLHQELKGAAEKDAGDESARPTPRSHITDLAPRRAGERHPHQHKNGAERKKEKIPGEDNQDREDAEQTKSTQPRRELVLL